MAPPAPPASRFTPHPASSPPEPGSYSPPSTSSPPEADPGPSVAASSLFSADLSSASSSTSAEDEEDESQLAAFDHLRGACVDEGEGAGDDPDDAEDDEQDGDEADGDELVEDNGDVGEVRVVSLPHLTEDVLLDEDALDIAVAEVVAASTAARGMAAEIERLHHDLADRLAPVDLAVVLRAAEMAEARLLVVLPIIAAWAWAEGCTCREEKTQ